MILLIDTSQHTGTVALAKDGRLLFAEENTNPKEHASWLHAAVQRLVEKANISIRQIEAIAVVTGPGSYTGIRVGLAAAKGFCYGLKIPLITHNSLRIMAESMKMTAGVRNAWICPLIDARRNEVFTAIYDMDMREIMPPQAMILDKNSFDFQLSQHPIIFFGSGAKKWENVIHSEFALFEPEPPANQAFINLSTIDFNLQNWSDPVYTEPLYLKEFFSY
jgi:tRNA threonylcarbamoyladenosine biosynthesis protein TsaB